MAGDYLETYTSVQEIVVTREAECLAVLRRGHGARRRRIFENLLTFRLDKDIDQGIHLVLHAYQEILLAHNYWRMTKPVRSHHFELMSIPISRYDMPSEYLRGISSNICFGPDRTDLEPSGRWDASETVARFLAVLCLEHCHGGFRFCTKCSSGERDRLQTRTIYDLPQLLLSPTELPWDREEAETMTRDRLRSLLSTMRLRSPWGWTTISFSGSSTQSEFAEAVLSHVRLEESGDRAEQYPWLTPVTVSSNISTHVRSFAI
jgi:hypothetical protein